MSNDIYCEQIIPGKIPIDKFFESDNFLVYFHTNPFWEFHLVLIPKFHIVDIYEIKDNSIRLEFFEVLSGIVNRVRKEKKECQVMFNVGEYQHSKHLHIHIHSGKKIRD